MNDLEKIPPKTMNVLFTFLASMENTALWICTPDYKKQLFLSDGFEKIWGRPKEQMFNSIKVWVETLIPEDLTSIQQELSQRSKEANRCSTVNFRIHRPDGEVRFLKSTSFTTFDKSARPVALIGIDENLSAEQWHQSNIIHSKPLPILTELSLILDKQLTDANTATPSPETNAIKINDKIIYLTEREKQCLNYLIEGRSAKETAYFLKISTRTVETYLNNLRQKTNCKTKIKLIGTLQQQFMNHAHVQ
jgi:DNA-binding CsgD family transcriptional regulator